MAKVMEEKASSVGLAIQGLEKGLNAAAKDAQKQRECKAVLDPLISAIDQCKVTCEMLCQQGFMKAMFKAKSNSLRIEKLLKAVDDRMDALSMKVANTHLDLSIAMDQKLDKIQSLLEKMEAGGVGKSDPAEMDPQVLADIAKQAGMEASEAIKQELCSMSTRMLEKQDEILDVVSAMSEQLLSMDRKQDQHHDILMRELSSMTDIQVGIQCLCLRV
jgi:uncharacterized protein YidB (DUF937 family)